MCRCCGRPEGFTELICENWTRRVAETDLVVHLGDVVMPRDYDHLLKMGFVQCLPGQKVLVRGNHDLKSPEHCYAELGFEVVVDALELDDIWCTHKPSDVLPDGFSLNLCGHVHNNLRENILRYDAVGFKPWHYVLSLEQMEYSPQPLGEIRDGKWHRKDLQ